MFAGTLERGRCSLTRAPEASSTQNHLCGKTQAPARWLQASQHLSRLSASSPRLACLHSRPRRAGSLAVCGAAQGPPSLAGSAAVSSLPRTSSLLSRTELGRLHPAQASVLLPASRPPSSGRTSPPLLGTEGGSSLHSPSRWPRALPSRRLIVQGDQSCIFPCSFAPK